jgi:hypothetical protein
MRKMLMMCVLASVVGYNGTNYGGHPAPAGRALPNLLMRSVFKSQLLYLGVSQLVYLGVSQNRVDFGLRRDKQVDFDFNILTALKGWVGLAP